MISIRNTETSWGIVSRVLHWLIAIGIFVLLWLGIEQSGMPRGDERTEARGVHAGWALIVLVLMTTRIIWRLTNTVPHHPDGVPGWQRASASIVHWGIYFTVFLQLTAGMMERATADTFNAIPFFSYALPVPIAPNDSANALWESVHNFAWMPLAILIIVHMLGALYNHFVNRNDVLRRMTVG